MPVGDSITYGVGYLSTNTGGYRVHLYDLVIADSKRIDFVGTQHGGPSALVDDANEGYSGKKIDTATGGSNPQIREAVETTLATITPDIMQVMFGTNDTDSFSDPVTHVPPIIVRAQDAIRSFHALAPSAIILWGELVGSDNTIQNNQMLAFNAAMPAAIATLVSEGIDVRLVSLYGSITKQDGLHPDNAGYDTIADRWYTALGPLL